jgi:predicted esterase
MKLNRKTITQIALLIAVCMLPGMAQPQDPAERGGPAAGASAGTSRITSAPPGKTAGQSRRTGMDPVDDRVELREYYFADTDEWLPYAVFVSSKVSKDKKAPMVLALHGFSGNHGTFMRTPCVEEAEKNGYILVGVMGYSPSAPFGRTMGARSAAPGAVPGAPPVAARGPAPGTFPGGRGPTVGGTKETDRDKVSALGEKDTMNVLEMVRKEFKIDNNRIYLMGHSMGGAGALYLGEKYAPVWAGVAALAGFGSLDPKGKMKDTPLYLTAGSLDQSSSSGRSMAEQLKAGGMDCEFKEVPGLDHGGIIGGSMPDVFKFFNEHIKK